MYVLFQANVVNLLTAIVVGVKILKFDHNHYFRSSIRILVIILPEAEISCLLKKQVLKMIMQKNVPILYSDK